MSPMISPFQSRRSSANSIEHPPKYENRLSPISETMILSLLLLLFLVCQSPRISPDPSAKLLSIKKTVTTTETEFAVYKVEADDLQKVLKSQLPL